MVHINNEEEILKNRKDNAVIFGILLGFCFISGIFCLFFSKIWLLAILIFLCTLMICGFIKMVYWDIIWRLKFEKRDKK